jgi:hypothetical protein
LVSFRLLHQAQALKESKPDEAKVYSGNSGTTLE